MVELRPVASRYQLWQPPRDHTVRTIRRSTVDTKSACAPARGSTAPAPVRSRYDSADKMYATCDSIMYTTDVWPSPVLGPSNRNRFGNPCTVTPRYALGLPCHTSARVR